MGSGDPVFVPEERLWGRLPAARGVQRGGLHLPGLELETLSPLAGGGLWPHCPWHLDLALRAVCWAVNKLPRAGASVEASANRSGCPKDPVSCR